MSLAELVILSVKVEGRSQSEVALDYRISRYWVHQLLKRYEAEGQAAFQPRSRRPHHNPRAVDPATEERIVRLRKELSRQGFDAGAETIRAHLRREATVARIPATSTIWRILCRRGFVTRQPRKRPKGAGKRLTAAQPNERWPADATHWRLADATGESTGVEILNIIDDHSRLALSCQARPTVTGEDVLTGFRRAFRGYGIPARVLTDNGAVFTGKPRRGGWVALEIELDLLGVRFDHSRPNHPQTCGKVEPATRPRRNGWPPNPGPQPARAADPAGPVPPPLQHPPAAPSHRPTHPRRGLRGETQGHPSLPTISPHYRVRRDRIDNGGVITIRYDSKLRHIGLGRQHRGKRVLALIADRYIRVVDAETGGLLRELTLDPSRDYQPLDRLPGPPKRT
jgi:transposase